MTDPGYTHIGILADRTGSMGEIADRGSGKTKAELTTTGIRDLVRDQKAQPGRTTFSLVQFDTQSTDRVAWFTSGDDPEITGWKIEPRLGTPLLDATARFIIETGQHLSEIPEAMRPGRVIIVIGTDVEENSSREYKREQVTEMIQRQHDQFGWDFVFIGADIAAYAATSDAITRSRAGGQSVSYSNDERDRVSGS